MANFWRYQVRYRLARLMIHAGLRVMPRGVAHTELCSLLCWWAERVAEVARSACDAR